MRDQCLPVEQTTNICYFSGTPDKDVCAVQKSVHFSFPLSSITTRLSSYTFLTDHVQFQDLFRLKEQENRHFIQCFDNQIFGIY